MSDTTEIVADLRKMQAQIIHGPSIFGGAANLIVELEHQRDALRSERDSLAKQRGEAIADGSRMMDERDALKEGIDLVDRMHRKASAERDELRTQVERLKVTLETMSNHIKNLVQSRNAFAINYRKTDVARLVAIRERDDARMDLAGTQASESAFKTDNDALRAEVAQKNRLIDDQNRLKKERQEWALENHKAIRELGAEIARLKAAMNTRKPQA